MPDIDKVRVKMTSVPFNHTWPGGRVSVVRELGPALLDRSLAEAAIKAGAAVPFDPAPAPRSAPRRRSQPTNTAGDAEQQADKTEDNAN